WGVAEVEANVAEVGLAGSPTKVKKIENIVFQAKESKRLTASQADIDELMAELIANHTLG
ncbi:MAG: electron transfer flavoprotein beta subunit/FixA family protein, partial [Rikenellaceae bacterium]|nr:electron transfer flavoprotein beta subunit/FixA family protein [Rikenellaceae bacterium]